MKIIGIIPARYASTRLPAKPLAIIQGISMIQRVYNQCLKCSELSEVYVATDHLQIYDHVRSFGGKVVLTATHHQTGTERCAEALQIIENEQNTMFDAVINIQGDEPFIEPQQISILANCIKNTNCKVATLVHIIENEQDITQSSVVKVVLNAQNEALYFSRQAIPFIQNAKALPNHIFYKHVGIYAYFSSTLKHLVTLAPAPLELAESLEQLRWLYYSINIQTALTPYATFAIDTPQDLEKAQLWSL